MFLKENKFCVRNKCCALGQTGKYLCPQQCVRNIVSSFATALRDSARTATKWYDHNLLAGNLKKYQTMNIGYSQDYSAAHAICVNNEEIKTVESLNLLGVTIDSKLNSLII